MLEVNWSRRRWLRSQEGALTSRRSSEETEKSTTTTTTSSTTTTATATTRTREEEEEREEKFASEENRVRGKFSQITSSHSWLSSWSRRHLFSVVLVVFFLQIGTSGLAGKLKIPLFFHFGICDIRSFFVSFFGGKRKEEKRIGIYTNF